MTKEELIEDLKVQCSDDLIKEVVEYVEKIETKVMALNAAVLHARLCLEFYGDNARHSLVELEKLEMRAKGQDSDEKESVRIV